MLEKKKKWLGLMGTAVVCVFLFLVDSALAADCNNNQVEDADDITAGTSADCNLNEVPDECDIAGQDVGFNAVNAGGRYRSIGSVSVADLDGDGDLDLATNESNNNPIAEQRSYCKF